MSDFINDGLRKLTRASKRAVRNATSESSLRSLRHNVSATRSQAEDTTRAVAHSPVVKTAATAAKVTVTSGPVKQVAAICGRAGVASAVVDGSMGGFQAMKAMREGKIDGRQAAIHTGAEAGCGFVTGSTGTAGTIVAYMLTGTMGPAALIAGMGASIGSRYVYRQVVGETLPSDEKSEKKDDEGPDEPPMEDIGPKPQ